MWHASVGVRLIAQLKCIYTNARSMGNKQEELEPLHSRTAMTWSPSQKCGGMTLMTGVLLGMAINSLEGIGKEREAVEWGLGTVSIA